MKNTIEELVNLLIEKNIIDVNSIPNIDLYVDQLIGFIIENSYSNNENHLTKSMVNNYSKNKVIPPSIKKKYSKNHILLLIIIYNTKSIISISDIKTIFSFFEEDKITDYYNTLTKLILNSNSNFLEKINKDLDAISLEANITDDKLTVAILATKLAIEANYKKMLSELLIEKFLTN